MPAPETPGRLAGLLVPAFALRRDDDLGIGDTIAVREAIDFCAEHAFGVLQILPVQETLGDHSPYNPISSRALSPALLALTPSEVPGLTPEMIERAAPESWLRRLRQGIVKHHSVHPLKLQILLAAHGAFRATFPAEHPWRREFEEFQSRQAGWLRAYSLFRLLVREYEGNADWSEWRPEHQGPATAEAWLARHAHREALADVREGYAFVQWVAWRQWRDVRRHADERGVLLMGELSFGVSRASADAWQHPDLFDPDWSLGTPPLAFFDTTPDSERWGQNWGLPAYRWENHRATGFAWLRQRVAAIAERFHLCRIDHLRGYFRSYQFPWYGGPQHAAFSRLTDEEVRQHTGGRMPRFVPGPDNDPASAERNEVQGRELIAVLRSAAGGMGLIGEIMGELPDYMARTLDELAMPDLTFPQLEVDPDGALRPPETFRPLSLAIYATHDNAPLAALYLHLREEAREDPAGAAARSLERLLRFAAWEGPLPDALDDNLLAALQRALFDTPCALAVLLSSDLLGIAQRFNLPGSFGRETWCERLELSLRDYAKHPVFGPRIETAARLIRASGRAPRPESSIQERQTTRFPAAQEVTG